MIHIVTGAIDEGKTRKMNEIYHQLRQGDGFLSNKIFIDPSTFTGYEIQRLGSGERIPLAYKAEYIPAVWDEAYRLGPYSFSREAFRFVDKMIDEIVGSDIEPVFIDEIGPLELSGRGFFTAVVKVLNTHKEVYITVRTHCVEDVINKFNIRDYTIIKVNKEIR
jgi:nucleoside-triphosphatase THEP1